MTEIEVVESPGLGGKRKALVLTEDRVVMGSSAADRASTESTIVLALQGRETVVPVTKVGAFRNHVTSA
jgi:hypothetical protein